MSDEGDGETLLTAEDAARIIGVGVRQLWRYKSDNKIQAVDGLVQVVQSQPAKLFRRADVLRLKAEREGRQPPAADV